MLKNLRYLPLAAALMLTAAGCQEDAEDAFSQAPVAPALAENGYILMTQNTMSESITWAWTAARHTTGDVTYQLYATYDDGTPVAVGQPTSALTQTVSKADFKACVDAFGAPSNSSFVIKMFVRATVVSGSYDSDPIVVTVYSYGDAVAAVVTPEVADVVLNMETPDAEVSLLSWEEARLGYAEDILYAVRASYKGGAEVELGSGIVGTAFTLTTDALNEAVVATGAPEEEAAAVDFVVYASSATVDACPSQPVTITVTTYKATYPAQLYLPGSYQGWDPASAPTIAQSRETKGLFEAFVDLSTADGSDVEFKFSPVPEWSGDFGSDDLASQVMGEGDYTFTVASGTTVGSGNLKVPSGMYVISCDMKHKTVTLIQVKAVSMIGGFNGWAGDVDMEYDAANRRYTVVTSAIQEGDEYKFRLNHDWTYSIGDNGAFTGGANYKLEKASGEYKYILEVGAQPFGHRIVGTSFDEYIYFIGSTDGWVNPDQVLALTDEASGTYTGFVYVADPNGWGKAFKFQRVAGSWDNEINAGTFASMDGVSGDNNIEVADDGVYYMEVSLGNATIKATPITSMRLVGDFNGWNPADDAQLMTWNADGRFYEITGAGVTDSGWKFTANGEWAINLGGDASDLVADGANLSVTGSTIRLYPTRTSKKVIYTTVE